MNLNPQWLTTFKHLVNIGHFTKTANALHMTQPGVSQHIQKLEEACGHPLIKRYNKTFEITEQGKLVYQYAQQQALREQKLLESLNRDSPYVGECKLSCSGSLAQLIYPPLINLQRENTKLTVNLEAAPNHKILKDIESRTTTLGIVTTPPETSHFYHQNIGTETLCLVLPKSYQNHRINLETLQSLGVVEHPDLTHHLALYLTQCGDSVLKQINTHTIPTIGYVNQLSQILLPVAKGVGFTVIQKSVVDNFPDKDKLFTYQPPKEVKETLYLVHRQHYQLPMRYQYIMKVILPYLQSI